MGKRFFTVREANDLIPFLTDRLQRLYSTYKELKAGCEVRTPPPQDLFIAGGMPVDTRYFHLIYRIHSLSSEISAEGCEIKDLESGLIDFPTIWEGREVFLCWRLGESEVNHWHEIEDGFAGRQPLRIDLGCTKKRSPE
jgi:hypothetical protein